MVQILILIYYLAGIQEKRGDSSGSSVIVRNSKISGHWGSEERAGNWPNPYPGQVITFYETSDKFKVYFDNVAAPQFDFRKRLNRMSNYVNGVDPISFLTELELSIGAHGAVAEIEIYDIYNNKIDLSGENSKVSLQPDGWINVPDNTCGIGENNFGSNCSIVNNNTNQKWCPSSESGCHCW